MKVISYSLFGDPSDFEFGYYLRGIYFNVRMNRLLMPGFQTWIYTTSNLINKYRQFWHELVTVNPNIVVYEQDNAPQRCLGMLWRMKPLFEENVEFVLCRDADSVITYREAMCNWDFVKSAFDFHAINDNDAHGGMMGGLVGFRAKKFLEKTGYIDFNHMVKGLDLNRHGSDQHFMNQKLHPKLKRNLLVHKLRGAGMEAAKVETTVPESNEVDRKLWVTDLISRYIGSAGVIDFELIRFFNWFDYNEKITKFEQLFPHIFYWQWKH